MTLIEVPLNPVDKVVLESALYRLMEEVRSEQLVDICAREVRRKWVWVG